MSRTTAPASACAEHPHRLRRDLPCTSGQHDRDLWHDRDTSGAAKALCRRCPVRDDCLAWAIDTGQADGVWGGWTANQIVEAHRRRKGER